MRARLQKTKEGSAPSTGPFRPIPALPGVWGAHLYHVLKAMVRSLFEVLLCSKDRFEEPQVDEVLILANASLFGGY